MNQSTDESAALGRIIQAIKHYSQSPPNSRTVSERSKDAYLKRHLSKQDWLFWKQLQTEPEEILADNQESSLDQVLSFQQFSLLLAQYKRAGFESYQVWCQTQKKSIFVTDDPLRPC